MSKIEPGNDGASIGMRPALAATHTPQCRASNSPSPFSMPSQTSMAKRSLAGAKAAIIADGWRSLPGRNPNVAGKIVGRDVHQDADASHARGLLPPRRDRPRRRRATEEGDELAPFDGLRHSILPAQGAP
jgi:hypothetical protein